MAETTSDTPAGFKDCLEAWLKFDMRFNPFWNKISIQEKVSEKHAFHYLVSSMLIHSHEVNMKQYRSDAADFLNESRLRFHDRIKNFPRDKRFAIQVGTQKIDNTSMAPHSFYESYILVEELPL